MTDATTTDPRCGWGWVTADHASVTGSMGHVCSRDPSHAATADGTERSGAGFVEHVCSCGARAHARYAGQ